MGADLRFDLQEFNTAINKYEALLKDMNDLKDSLEGEIENLKSESWNSEAGEKFMEHYENNWKANVTTYTNFLTHLKENLSTVKTIYETLYNRAENLNLP